MDGITYSSEEQSRAEQRLKFPLDRIHAWRSPDPRQAPHSGALLKMHSRVLSALIDVTVNFFLHLIEFASWKRQGSSWSGRAVHAVAINRLRLVVFCNMHRPAIVGI